MDSVDSENPLLITIDTSIFTFCEKYTLLIVIDSLEPGAMNEWNFVLVYHSLLSAI